ncbi:WecB/TagA/CpsF family glycosyltransferase [Deinococcus daejeonensis]|uniref:Glycosyl transferase n=1 Tax=Deinococcus daejeonensis TaxID=1007098 RepID=A0ABQ2J338_9DEIO|nr:WecB/TagA/CpsF family glycosyltransferase [Deinococcus daejeonensis]GGN38148.1 glycosyl transferase [Deinococcus daejeonensis]
MDGFTKDSLLENSLLWANSSKPILVLNHNLHSVYLAQRDPEMARAYDRADAVHIDGMPLIWLSRLTSNPLKPENRLTCLDWIEELISTWGKSGKRIFVLGGQPGVADHFVAHILKNDPDLHIASHHGYFGDHGEAEVVRLIRDFKPDVLLLGLGMPLQEKWALRHIDSLGVPLVWTLGAFMDLFAGVQVTPPRWLARLGFEGVFRLFANPRRLWRRYLVEPPALLFHFVRGRIFRTQRS